MQFNQIVIYIRTAFVRCDCYCDLPYKIRENFCYCCVVVVGEQEEPFFIHMFVYLGWPSSNQ